MLENIGIVLIGRNEGERLVNCLRSIPLKKIVYVDSGSEDNSISNAQQAGADVVRLAMDQGFTAGRARNVGFHRLMALYPELEFVQFIDGDCELCEGWLEAACTKLAAETQVAVVCGQRIEKYPDVSLYNLLCAIEWDTPIGYAKSCGGDALYRADVFAQVGGFDENFIAGEEPELCFRIRALGYKIFRLDQEMTRHDAAMFNAGQWWKRTKRSGAAYALGYLRHGKTQERFRLKECRSIVFWGGALPALILLFAVGVGKAWGLLLFLIYPLYALKVYRNQERVKHRFGRSAAGKIAAFIMLSKFPQFLGLITVFCKRFRGRQIQLIEYK